MGLDMYLSAKKYVPGWSHYENTDEWQRLIEMFDMQEFITEESPSAYVEFTVAYWRKANQIHQWFVDNVQDGRDECMPHYVDRDKLIELRETCLRVLASTELVEGKVYAGTVYNQENPGGLAKLEPGQILADSSVAEEELPTTSGFFFGGTDYDEYYWEDLSNTVSQIDRVLALGGSWDFEYRSSW